MRRTRSTLYLSGSDSWRWRTVILRASYAHFRSKTVEALWTLLSTRGDAVTLASPASNRIYFFLQWAVLSAKEIIHAKLLFFWLSYISLPSYASFTYGGSCKLGSIKHSSLIMSSGMTVKIKTQRTALPVLQPYTVNLSIKTCREESVVEPLTRNCAPLDTPHANRIYQNCTQTIIIQSHYLLPFRTPGLLLPLGLVGLTNVTCLSSPPSLEVVPFSADGLLVGCALVEFVSSGSAAVAPLPSPSCSIAIPK